MMTICDIVMPTGGYRDSLIVTIELKCTPENGQTKL